MELETVIEESGPATQQECEICGASNFVQEGGFYYCSECNTQSQVSRLYVDEDFRPEYQRSRMQAATLRGEKRKQAKVKESRQKISSWEIMNVTLKNMVDSLVEIGFPEIIRVKILHLYTNFMKKRKVIFVSTSKSNIEARITLGEPVTNVRLFYGVKKWRRHACNSRRTKFFRSKKSQKPRGVELENINDEEQIRSRRMKKILNKKKAIEKEYLTKEKGLEVDEQEFENIIQEESRQESQSFSVGDLFSQKPKSIRPLYTEMARRLLKKAKALKTNSKVGYCRRKFIYEPRLRGRPCGQAALIKETRKERFTLYNCLLIVFIALRELGFPIVFSDIIWLYNVGILHTNNVPQLVLKIKEYENVVQDFSGFLASSRYSRFGIKSVFCKVNCNFLKGFLEFLGIKDFCYPKLKELVPKYIDEFVLPREFECLVNLVAHMFTFDDYVNDLSPVISLEPYRAIPEVIVVAMFVVMLKMLFGLDDRTEKFQSEFAKLVNKVVKEEVDKRGWEMEEWTELFVIEDWFRYLRRRDLVVRRELCCPLLYTPNNPPSVLKLDDMMRRCTFKDNRADVDTPQTEAAKSCQNMFEAIQEEACASAGEIPELKPYIPLPLPTESIIRQYIDRYPLVSDSSVKPELLKVSFVQKRLDFIWNPKKYVSLLKMKGYKVKIVQGDAINNFPSDYDENSKVVILFQPYKRYDDFIGNLRSDCSINMKFLLGLCEYILPGINKSKTELEHQVPLLQKLVNALGDLYITRVLREVIPFMTRWNEQD